MKKKQSDEAEARNFIQSFDRAREVDKWMAVVWEVRDGQLTMTNLQAFNFPRGDFLRCLAQFADACAKDTGKTEAPKEPEPLPRAEPDIKVFPAVDKAIEQAAPVPAGFPVTPPPTPEQVDETLKELPKVEVQRTDAAVVIHAEGHMPIALPAEATEAAITEAVEVYRAGVGATKR